MLSHFSSSYIFRNRINLSSLLNAFNSPYILMIPFSIVVIPKQHSSNLFLA